MMLNDNRISRRYRLQLLLSNLYDCYDIAMEQIIQIMKQAWRQSSVVSSCHHGPVAAHIIALSSRGVAASETY